ncbi:dihydropteroate synthase [Pseudobdellovibrio exovorus]|uniref:Pterin-binding domain-containing protein n=1 Tax=Pseudobdellovibrio exovorus JSS TaxID=1184267 RepID=M4VAI6_9BACT|nr:dihydropteroate synthase [Pseudobdellovibrio exovorus]AGH95016.1 hypothetical protein A11Q_798 [Pseudobdellovibrio exovorus JSS]
MRRTTVALGLGANLGNPIEQLRLSLQLLKQIPNLKVLRVSSLYESDAQLPENAESSWNQKFLNAAVLCEVRADLSAQTLLSHIKEIELKIGRAQADRWAPRRIDIDILYWDQEPYSDLSLSIPHRQLFERPFALLPLLEVWPQLRASMPERLPHWAQAWVSEKPFQTQISSRYFWPRMVGVLNVTQDSFSDGGRYLNSDALLEQIEKLLTEGADIIDIGAESTRPQALAVSEEQELQTLDWALTEIQKFNKSLPLSLDCRRAGVVRSIIEKFDISYLNDVSGFSSPEMQDLLVKTKKRAFVMHSLTVPPRADQTLSEVKNPIDQLVGWWQRKALELKDKGAASEQLIFDPGIGFGTSKKQSLYILNHLEEMSDIKSEVMIGHSRKSYQTEYSDRPASMRDMETALMTQKMNMAYVQFLRVHDIESQKTALRAKV